MTPFLQYQLKAGLCIMLFTGLYYILFRKETFYRFNRIYLIGSLLLSIIIPAVHLPQMTAGNTLGFPRLIKEVVIYAGNVSPVNTLASQSSTILWWIYKGMCLLLSVYLLFQLINLVILIVRRGITAMDGYRLVILPEKAQSFSFFNLVFLNAETDRSADINPVLKHEMAHVRQWHSLDIMLIQLIKIFQWFNPFIYLMEKALKETHEYLADEAVLEQDGEFDRYRMLLLTQVFGIQPGIFSFFNYSLIKKRLTMMTKEKSPLRYRLKYLTILPLIFVMGLIICCNGKSVDNTLENVAPPPPPPPPVNVDEKTNEAKSAAAAGEQTFVVVDEMAKFQGGSIETYREWVQKNLVYPPEAIKNGIFGRVIVQFTVDSKGEVCDIKVLRSASPLLDKETVRIIESSPDWIPALKEGKNVRQQFTMPVIFQLQ